MPFKINIADKSGKTYKLELETEEFIGKSLHDKINGKELLADLTDYEFEITGASDKSGFTTYKNVQGIGTKRILLTYGKAMKKKPRKEGKKKISNPKPKGLRLRKTVRGTVISPEIVQINLKILKQGSKKLSEVFPDQNKSKEPAKEGAPKQEEPKKEAEKQRPEQEEKKETPITTPQ
ncbi:MAG TPA: S6e family ribosomal protein [Bacillota bacterium]|nr:S6e family ribosomal protein [Bacillota bacterium]